MRESYGITRRTLVGQLTALALSRTALSQVPLPQISDDPLRQLRAGHPRLILVEADFDRIRLLVRENSPARKIYADLEKECDRLLSIPSAEYKLVGPRMSMQTRRAIDRITSLALMYRLTGRDPWLRRAMLEMNAVAAFKDWNPARFIDTAEFTHAFAIGYDWLYNALSTDERTTVREAIITKALDPAFAIYQPASTNQLAVQQGPPPAIVAGPPGSAWSRQRPHWNIVCNAALAMGALAIAEPEKESTPDKPAAILRAALESIPHGLQVFSPEGAWPDGATNGEYATRYATLLFASLETALGTDYGLSASRNFERAARFRLYTTGPSTRPSNPGGALDDTPTSPEMFWMAKRYAAPAYAWNEQKQIDKSSSADAMDLAWFERDSRPPQSPAWPLDIVFPSVSMACFRSAWEDPNAIFLAAKGGDNKLGRGHADLGIFVLDAGGVRWAADLDAEDTGAVSPPWAFRTEAHNTLLVDGLNQDARAEARITRQELAHDLSWVQIDLSKANGSHLRQWTRRIGLAQRQAALIEDTLRSDQPVDVLWGMVTDAEIALNGSSAILHKNGWNLALDVRNPRHAVFDIAPWGPANPPPGNAQPANPQSPPPLFRKLIVRLGDKVADLDLSILLTPYRDGQPKPKVTAQFPVA